MRHRVLLLVTEVLGENFAVENCGTRQETYTLPLVKLSPELRGKIEAGVYLVARATYPDSANDMPATTLEELELAPEPVPEDEL